MAIDQTTASSPMSSDEGSHRHGPIGVILDVAVRFRWAIIVLTVFAAIYGAFNLVRLPIDAVPDITNVQVQINTVAPALSPVEIEQQRRYQQGGSGHRAASSRAQPSPVGRPSRR